MKNLFIIEDTKAQQQKRYNVERTPEKTAQTYTVLIQQDEGWWIGWIQEVRGVTCQERTKHELLDTLKITLREALEFYPLQTARRTKDDVDDAEVTESGCEAVEIAI